MQVTRSTSLTKKKPQACAYYCKENLATLVFTEKRIENLEAGSSLRQMQAGPLFRHHSDRNNNNNSNMSVIIVIIILRIIIRIAPKLDPTTSESS